MREILFRGKCADTGEWVEGCYVLQSGKHIIFAKDTTWHYYIDESTVGQYTGLTDRNGKKIFEGDIVRDMRDYLTHLVYARAGMETQEQAEKYRNKGRVKAVEFDTENVGSCGCCYGEFSGSGFIANGMDLYNCEIIGSIHDNPELLN